MKKERSAFVDIIKAIGIISIVIGHCGWYITSYNINIGSFVYTYHIMIFMLTAGYCFKEADMETPFFTIGKKLRNLLPLFVAYNLLFIMLHNLLNRMNVLPINSEYNFDNIVTNFLNSFVFVASEPFLAAFWFVPVLLIADLFLLVILQQGSQSTKI